MSDGAGFRFVVNPDSGPDRRPDVAPMVKEALPAAEVVELDGTRTCGEILADRPPPSVFGVAGGDGTVSAVAAIALDERRPLAVLPGGTLNHFAVDLGLESVEHALEVIARGDERAVDVAEIDGRRFVNNASLGAYPEIVDVRERFEKRVGKWPALVIALLYVLRRGHPCHVEVDGRARRVWLAFFGNCHYDQAGLIAPAGRSRLDDGLIDVRLVHADRKWARLRLLACALAGRVERCSVYEAFVTARLTVRSLDGGTVRLAADGETFDANEAFEVRKLPSALRVFATPPDAASPADA